MKMRRYLIALWVVVLLGSFLPTCLADDYDSLFLPDPSYQSVPAVKIDPENPWLKRATNGFGGVVTGIWGGDPEGFYAEVINVTAELVPALKVFNVAIKVSTKLVREDYAGAVSELVMLIPAGKILKESVFRSIHVIANLLSRTKGEEVAKKFLEFALPKFKATLREFYRFNKAYLELKEKLHLNNIPGKIAENTAKSYFIEKPIQNRVEKKLNGGLDLIRGKKPPQSQTQTTIGPQPETDNTDRNSRSRDEQENQPSGGND